MAPRRQQHRNYGKTALLVAFLLLLVACKVLLDFKASSRILDSFVEDKFLRIAMEFTIENTRVKTSTTNKSVGSSDVSLTDTLPRSSQDTTTTTTTTKSTIPTGKTNFQEEEEDTSKLPELSPPESDNDDKLTAAIKVQKCRLGIERMMNGNGKDDIGLINSWLKQRVPLVEQIWKLNKTLEDGSRHVYYRVFLHIKHMIDVDSDLRKLGAILESNFTWEDQFGAHHAAHFVDSIRRAKVKDNEFIMLELDVPHQAAATVGSKEEEDVPVPVALLPLTLNATSGESTPRYDLTRLLECDAMERELSRTPPEVKLAGCLKFRGPKHEVREWIHYHRMMGWQHFWVFVNEKWDISQLPVADDITYVPYNFNWNEHKKYSGIKLWRDGDWFWQVQAYNQCLYRAKQYGIQWITTHDTDEYFKIIDPEMANTTYPFRTLLSKYNHREEIGFLEMKSVGIGRHRDIEPANKTFEFTLDYTYRRQLKHVPYRHRDKGFWRVNVADGTVIHWLAGPERNETNTVFLKDETEAHVLHFKTPHGGVFQTRNYEDLVQDTSVRDKYRDRIAKKMQEDRLWGSVDLYKESVSVA